MYNEDTTTPNTKETQNLAYHFDFYHSLCQYDFFEKRRTKIYSNILCFTKLAIGQSM